jgi:arginyl-tRNA--protein-N-Asp/Glu arginylyltransferase
VPRLIDTERSLAALQFYDTAAHVCSYLPGKQAVSRVAFPPQLVDADIYSDLVANGFRRSGDFAYRPACQGCSACVPVRVPVARFIPDRGQRRCLEKHRAFEVKILPLEYTEDHYRLYATYQSRRHPGGGMDMDAPEQYVQFLLRSQVDTCLLEFRENGELRMVSVVDVLNDGLSAVYTFFDPDIPGAGLGTYSILWLIDRCRASDLHFLYLGYWVSQCRKMSYKSRFQPIEGLINGRWQRLFPETFST